MKLAFLMALTLGLARSEEVDNRLQNYSLNDRYKGGEHLIYDCQRKHYACVDLAGFSLCRDRREENLKLKAPEYDCAPLQSFQDKKSCVLKNYEIMEKNAWKRFCFPK